MAAMPKQPASKPPPTGRGLNLGKYLHPAKAKPVNPGSLQPMLPPVPALPPRPKNAPVPPIVYAKSVKSTVPIPNGAPTKVPKMAGKSAWS